MLHILRFCILYVACGRDDQNREDDIEPVNESDNREKNKKNYIQQIDDMKKKLDASEEHNISLRGDKKKLEREDPGLRKKICSGKKALGNLKKRTQRDNQQTACCNKAETCGHILPNYCSNLIC